MSEQAKPSLRKLLETAVLIRSFGGRDKGGKIAKEFLTENLKGLTKPYGKVDFCLVEVKALQKLIDLEDE